MTGIIIFLIVLVLLVLGVVGWAVGQYNSLVGMRNRVQESWRQIDVELNRRYELIPNLVETVRGYAGHERGTLEDITRLRNQAVSLASHEGATPSAERAQAEEQLSGAVRNLMVSVEAYPDLKANTNFLELQRALTETEDRIAAGRRYYNANVRNYNTKIESFPTNMIAGPFNFEKAAYFEVADHARAATQVNFGDMSARSGQGLGGQQAPQALPQQQSGIPAVPTDWDQQAPQGQPVQPPQQFGQQEQGGQWPQNPQNPQNPQR